jgi:hypothetical protein
LVQLPIAPSNISISRSLVDVFDNRDVAAGDIMSHYALLNQSTKNKNMRGIWAYRAFSQAHASFMIVISSCIGRPAASLESTAGRKFWIGSSSGSGFISLSSPRWLGAAADAPAPATSASTGGRILLDAG